MLDSPPNNLETSSRGRLLCHGKAFYDLGQSHRVFFLALAKVSTITAADNMEQSSSSDDESSNCL
jgi:hypothetical protein